MNCTDRVWTREEVVDHYLDGVRGGIPLAAEQIRVLLRLVAAAVPQPNRFLDLGCGDGVLGSALLGRWRSARGVFLDFSERMLGAARAKVPAPASHHFILQDYGQPDWTGSLMRLRPFDVIVSGFSIHHQSDAMKRSIYRDIFDLLRPGGLFLNLEHVASSSRWGAERFDDHFIDALCAFHERRGGRRSRAQIAREYVHRPDKPANILAPVESQCRWLRRIGFVDVDCWLKVFELALFGGRKPPTSLARPSQG